MSPTLPQPAPLQAQTLEAGKGLASNDLNNHDFVVTHLESEILECKVKWVLAFTTNKASGEVVEFQLSYLQS